MLKIRCGTNDDTITNVDDFFNYEYEDEWFSDDLVQRMILDVDKSKVISEHIIDSPVLGLIPPTQLSGGVKALILMLKTDNEIWATACGDNCSKWILEIAKLKELQISLEHYLKFEDNEFEYFDVNLNKTYPSYWNRIMNNPFT